MKSFIIRVMCIILVSLVGCQITKAQDTKVQKEGKTFIASSSRGSSDKDVATIYTWRDSKGNEYPIFLHQYTKGENEGKWTAYVKKVSAKTNKEYKYYIPDGMEIAEQIRREMK